MGFFKLKMKNWFGDWAVEGKSKKEEVKMNDAFVSLGSSDEEKMPSPVWGFDCVHRG